MQQRVHTFSYYLLLKQSNPSKFYTAANMKQMLQSCRYLGAAYFDAPQLQEQV